MFRKGLLFLLITAIILFLNRFLSIIFTSRASSLFAFFGGFTINYTATFFFILAVSTYNIKHSFQDERFRAAIDIITGLVWFFSLFLLLFPMLSYHLEFVDIPFIEFTFLLLISGFYPFMKTSDSVRFYIRLSWRIFFIFLIPYFFFLYSQFIKILIVQLFYMVPIKAFFYGALLLLIMFYILSLFIKKGTKIRYFLAIFGLSVLSFFLYTSALSSGKLSQVYRIGLIFFYVLLIPAAYLLYKNSSQIYETIQGETGAENQ